MTSKFQNTDFSKTIVYSMTVPATGEILYVGSTVLLLKYRMGQHHRDAIKFPQIPLYKRIERLGGWHEVSVAILEHYSTCTSNLEKRQRERLWFDALRPSMNGPRPAVTAEERLQQRVTADRRYRLREHIRARRHTLYLRRRCVQRATAVVVMLVLALRM